MVPTQAEMSNQTKKNGGTGAAILNAQEAENVNLLDEFDGFRLFVSLDVSWD